MQAFEGAKIAVIADGRVLTLLRDDVPHIPFPDHWDLPGGGREGDEDGETCALRELQEELGLILDPARIVHRRFYPGPRPGWFFAALWPGLDLRRVRLGSEGQRWEAMPVAAFLSHRKAIPHFQERLRGYWEGEKMSEDTDYRLSPRNSVPRI